MTRRIGTPTRASAWLASITLPESAACLGQTLGAQKLGAVGVQVASVRLASGRVTEAEEMQLLYCGDTLVLSGLPAALALAEQRLLRRA